MPARRGPEGSRTSCPRRCLLVVGLGRRRDALAERVPAAPPLLRERVRVVALGRLAGPGGVDAVLGLVLGGRLGRARDALAERVLAVLVGAVLLLERLTVGVALGLAGVGGVLRLRLRRRLRL